MPESAAEIIADAADWRRTPLERKGFFTRPFLLESGPFAGRLEKRLHNAVPRELALAHAGAIADYAAVLRSCGIPVAETKLALVPAGRRFYISLFQERFPPEDLVTSRMQSLEPPAALALLERLLVESLKVIDYKRANDGREGREFGFHSSLRNWGFKGNDLFFLDLTPPLRRRHGRPDPPTYLRHTPKRFFLFRLRPLGDFLFRLGTRDSFDPTVLVAGLVTSTIHRRPELEEGALRIGRELIQNRLPAEERAAYLARIRPRRLKTHRKLNRAYRRLFKA